MIVYLSTPSRCADFPYLAYARRGRKDYHTQGICYLCSYVLIYYPYVYTGGHYKIASLPLAWESLCKHSSPLAYRDFGCGPR